MTQARGRGAWRVSVVVACVLAAVAVANASDGLVDPGIDPRIDSAEGIDGAMQRVRDDLAALKGGIAKIAELNEPLRNKAKYVLPSSGSAAAMAAADATVQHLVERYEATKAKEASFRAATAGSEAEERLLTSGEVEASLDQAEGASTDSRSTDSAFSSAEMALEETGAGSRGQFDNVLEESESWKQLLMDVGTANTNLVTYNNYLTNTYEPGFAIKSNEYHKKEKKINESKDEFTQLLKKCEKLNKNIRENTETEEHRLDILQKRAKELGQNLIKDGYEIAGAEMNVSRVKENERTFTRSTPGLDKVGGDEGELKLWVDSLTDKTNRAGTKVEEGKLALKKVTDGVRANRKLVHTQVHEYYNEVLQKHREVLNTVKSERAEVDREKQDFFREFNFQLNSEQGAYRHALSVQLMSAAKALVDAQVRLAEKSRMQELRIRQSSIDLAVRYRHFNKTLNELKLVMQDRLPQQYGIVLDQVNFLQASYLAFAKKMHVDVENLAELQNQVLLNRAHARRIENASDNGRHTFETKLKGGVGREYLRNLRHRLSQIETLRANFGRFAARLPKAQTRPFGWLKDDVTNPAPDGTSGVLFAHGLTTKTAPPSQEDTAKLAAILTDMSKRKGLFAPTE